MVHCLFSDSMFGDLSRFAYEYRLHPMCTEYDKDLRLCSKVRSPHDIAEIQLQK